MNNDKLKSIDVEKMCLAGILKFPQVVSDLPGHITERDFVSRPHQIIYTIIKNTIDENKPLETTLVADRIKHMGLRLEDDFDITDYLESFRLISINENSVIPYFQVLKKYSVARELDSTADSIKTSLRKNIDEDALAIINRCDEIYNQKIDLLDSSEKETVSIFEEMENIILGRASKPQEDIGVLSPFPIFNKYYGGFRNSNVYVWASRSGQGKSTLLSQIGLHIASNIEKPIKVLCLDTEMESEDQTLRLAAAISGVPFWFIDTGNWIKNPDMTAKIKDALALIKKRKIIYDHKYVANMNVDEICSLIRRWNAKTGRDFQAAIIYDYLKITNERISGENKEYMVMGDKVNKLKECVTSINSFLLSAIQINRTGAASQSNETEVNDDESVIALSDRVQWFCSYLGIFRRKTFREIELDGPQFGTHLIRTLKARFQGRESTGHADWVKIEVGGKTLYRPNYINYNVENFKVEERSCLKDMVARQIFKSNEVEDAEKDFYEKNKPEKLILERTNE